MNRLTMTVVLFLLTGVPAFSGDSEQTTIPKATPTFTGDLARDFQKTPKIKYQREEGASVTSTAAWDDEFLYLAWQVQDFTPWRNAAREEVYLYTSGDSVDFQLATDPKADRNRTEAAPGDLRISIGNYKGTNLVVVYRQKVPKGMKKIPRVFRSGVVAEFTVERVDIIRDAKVTVRLKKRQYTVEAAIPLDQLGLKITRGLKLRGDFGVTHSRSTGDDTTLRTYWSNKSTGMVADEVFELRLEPRYWGTLVFEK